ncbi:hypothetical protein QBZ16_002810 [Prototheca wickerhamii]|uniref:FAS1 domain-containing protein n=1 Tax=Prototheca wickerhamii TaxID=3111 RepID=A0AAD9IL18_PROWI|nr:hypothetical protein QBZ16_002810 [Prototheca wickerhamii]
MMLAVCQAQVAEPGSTPQTNITYMIELLQGAQLTVAGEELPPITICIPNNDAISALLQSFGVSIETALAALDANSLPAAIQERLNSLILYHVIPSGVLTPAELGAEGEVPTGLEGFTLQFNSEGTVITTPTGTSNVVASGESDGAAYLTIDAALLPAQFADIPQTTTADAQAILASLYQHHASPAAE